MLKRATKKNVLLVDDDRSIGQMLGMLLRTRGYEVKLAQSGAEALNRASSHTDLILLDLILPDVEGLDVCRRLKSTENTSRVPIIILSAKVLSEDIIEGLYIGADDYLTKPFECEELIARMEAVMRRSEPVREDSYCLQAEHVIISEIRHIIDEERVDTAYQPIFFLEPFHLLGFEALCRPVSDTMLSNPEAMFKAALQFGFYRDLELLSWRKAVEKAQTFMGKEKLFLNCNPYFVEDMNVNELDGIFEYSPITTRDIILEITERSFISNYEDFYCQLQKLREYGFRFAVDDVGGGYASLESIVETKPEVLKIDRHIISALNKDPYKKSIIKFIVAFCKENNILSIAEGIETETEFETVKELGVDAGQGYYLYRPTTDICMKDLHKIMAS